jgi:hypothetical protein
VVVVARGKDFGGGNDLRHRSLHGGVELVARSGAGAEVAMAIWGGWRPAMTWAGSRGDGINNGQLPACGASIVRDSRRLDDGGFEDQCAEAVRNVPKVEGPRMRC